MLIAVGQFQRDLQNELTAEAIAAAEAEGRYRGRPPALSGTPAEEARTAYLQQQEQAQRIAAFDHGAVAVIDQGFKGDLDVVFARLAAGWG